MGAVTRRVRFLLAAPGAAGRILLRRLGVILAVLGGGDERVLAKVPGGRGRFIAMAIVLFGTSALALVSMTFALHDGVKASWTWAAILGAGWALLIFNLDRFLVISIGATRGFLRLVMFAAPRLAMAALIAVVVSTPLVLRIFASSINYEMSNIQLQNSAAQQKAEQDSGEARQLKAVNQQIGAQETLQSGAEKVPDTDGTIQTDQNAVNELTAQVNTARQAMTTALSNYKCELEGPCPDPGWGPIAKQKLAIYQQAHQKYGNLSSQFAAATAKLQSDEGNFRSSNATYIATQQTNASKALPGLIATQQRLQDEINQREHQDTALNEANTGLPAQIQALYRLGDQDSVLFWTHLAVFLLFFTVEILPVSVKVLLNLGEETAYEKVTRFLDEAVVRREEADSAVSQAQAAADVDRENNHIAAEAEVARIRHEEEAAEESISADKARRLAEIDAQARITELQIAADEAAQLARLNSQARTGPRQLTTEEAEQTAQLDSQARIKNRQDAIAEAAQIEAGKHKVRQEIEADMRSREKALGINVNKRIESVVTQVTEAVLTSWAASVQAQASALGNPGANPGGGNSPSGSGASGPAGGSGCGTAGGLGGSPPNGAGPGFSGARQPPPPAQMTVTTTHGLPAEEDIDGP
jgi:Domain of unknown function (DUF4407)